MNSQQLSIALLAVGLTVGACGCRLAAPELKTQSGGPAQKDIALTQNQIRLRMRAMVGPMCGEIEQAADRIVAGTTNRAVQRAALEWKIEAMSAMRAALFQPDPLTALLDTGVLCNQMADYFETGPGRTSLGDSSPTAVATCRRLEETLAEVAATMTTSGDVSKTRAAVRQWAAAHPIGHSIAGRESSLNRVLDRDAIGASSIGEVVVEMTTSMDDLNRKLEIYSDQLLRQGRWEAQLFAMDLTQDFQMEKAIPLADAAVQTAGHAVEAVDRLVPAVERSLAVVEKTPALITSEREAAIKAVQSELTRTITFLQEERVIALERLTTERIAALHDLRDSLVEEREAIAQDLDLISVKVVDHAFLRAAELCVAVLIAVFLSLVLLLFLARRLFASPAHQN